jgi:hypothetical protein
MQKLLTRVQQYLEIAKPLTSVASTQTLTTLSIALNQQPQSHNPTTLQTLLEAKSRQAPSNGPPSAPSSKTTRPQPPIPRAEADAIPTILCTPSAIDVFSQLSRDRFLPNDAAALAEIELLLRDLLGNFSDPQQQKLPRRNNDDEAEAEAEAEAAATTLADAAIRAFNDASPRCRRLKRKLEIVWTEGPDVLDAEWDWEAILPSV